MKKIIYSAALISLTLTSCMKSKTCTCTDAGGKVFYNQTLKSTNKSELQKLEDDCNAQNSLSAKTGGNCVIS